MNICTKRKMKIFIILTGVLLTCTKIYGIDVHIPRHILECYRKNMTDINNNFQFPLTMKVLIELLQKIELNRNLDMRIMSTSIIYRLKFDGIQRATDTLETENIVPVGPTALHFKKFRILLSYLLSGDDKLFPSEALTKIEFCSLHRLISSSVQAWERGDEIKTCPQVYLTPNNKSLWKLMQGKQKSACPIEKGVVQSKWGDITAGHLLMAVAAALQNQDVKLMQIIDALKVDQRINFSASSTFRINRNTNEQINNLWASTLAGDLGEVTAYQRLFVDNIVMGQDAAGVWNDTLVPRAYYLSESIGFNWEMSQAETLAGIDGLIIGSAVKQWTEKVARLRLSQILDMYYSSNGVFFDENYRACKRKNNIKQILQNADLLGQTVTMTKLLQYYYLSNPAEEWVPIPEEKIQNFCEEIINKFEENLGALTDPYSACEENVDDSMKGVRNVPALDIFVVIDGTWTDYEGKRLIAALTHALDVSFYGSRIGFLRGNDGSWMTNTTHSIHQIFHDLAYNKSPWPTTLSVSKSLTTLISYLKNGTREQCYEKKRSPRNAVIIMLAVSDTLDSSDLVNSQSLVKTIKGISPHISILYVTSEFNAATYEELVRNEFNNDYVVKTQQSIETTVQRITERLKDFPGQIINLHCGIKRLEYEDYITPKQIIVYEIHYKILQDIPNEIKVKFSGHEYGNVSICANDKEYPEHKLCQWIDDRNISVEFATKPLCQHNYACNVQFKLSLVNTKNKCTDDDCRYPSQARIQIRVSWSSAKSFTSSFYMMAFLIYLTTWI